jgi:hypothetical protein
METANPYLSSGFYQAHHKTFVKLDVFFIMIHTLT